MKNKVIRIIVLFSILFICGISLTLTTISNRKDVSVIELSFAQNAEAESSGGGRKCRCEWFIGDNDRKDCSRNSWGQKCAPDGHPDCNFFDFNCK